MTTVSVGRVSQIDWNAVGFRVLLCMPLAALANLSRVATLSTLSIRPTDLVFLGAVAVWLCRAVTRTCLEKVETSFLLKIGALFVLALTGVAFLGNSVDWPVFLRFLETMVWGLLGLSFIKSKKQLSRYMMAVLIVAAVMSAASIGLYIVNPELHRIAGYMSYGGGESLEIQPGLNEWGAFYALALVIVLWKLYCEALTKWDTFLFGLISLGLVLDQSRSAYLSTAIAIGVVGFLYAWRARSRGQLARSLGPLVLICMPVVLAGLATEVLAVNRIGDSFEQGSNAEESIADRIYLWPKSTELLSANFGRFLIGYGSESFARLIGSPTADNFYLDHCVSEGFLGLLLILSILVAPVVSLRAGHKENLRLLGLLVLGVGLIVSVTGNVLISIAYGGVTFTLLYGLQGAQGSGGSWASA